MSFYLLEIGCEELPARFVPITINFLKDEFAKELKAARLDYTDLVVDGTPKRVFVYINALPDKQSDFEEVVQGPPANIAFNSDGSISVPGRKFAESKGLDIDSISKVSTPKGEYLTGVKKTIGVNTSSILQEIVPNIIKSIPFPKSMKWGDGTLRFARPLHTILSLWNFSALPVSVDNVVSGDSVQGHRFMSPAAVKVSDFEQYKKAMADKFVVLSGEERKNIIRKQMAELAKKGGYTVDEDEELLEHVANLVEYPYVIEGRFDDAFLELPAPVLITSMKHHQKYFPTYKDGKIQATFLGISNMKPDDDSFIRGGYQRVLKARLNDAMFFYKNDKAVPLEERTNMLKKVVYQEKLGTSYEKMERFRAIAEYLAKIIAPDKVAQVKEVATLCKADLMCEMVYEFPELQGFMGKVYAGLQGKPEEIAIAIEEHYMPRFAGDNLPTTDIGKIVAIADKLDTIAGAFSIGMIPSGNMDPYALRRNAIGIINIIDSAGWRISLKELISYSLNLLQGKATADVADTADKVLQFFIGRQKQIVTAQNIDNDAFDAAAIYFDDLISQKNRAEALTIAKTSEDFISVSQSFKRINNILRKLDSVPSAINPALFDTDEEKALYKVLADNKDSIATLIVAENYSKAISEMTLFAAPLNSFFDKVMVMAKDEGIKNNRLALISNIRDIFVLVGDLSLII